ncbi:unnamed protein product [Neospora caninum Liverpool]|uniref:EF hand domain-containing protein n=1 Tax=Neospora caninum (strain Liverpool) TaxID=572307 RepID=F0VHE4_NEOCL|nr:uncharacterized protein NCLIV_029255 [Neospora caninum Liverpool]CBZ53138.1 unnamed protein product [Neospora caninum Liverpool]CEL67129.1 TPA: EF hand domain-containing protein [Neospora caninum Liverpool]|eukprot:XP_003883170.1 uncharacterized protein NCLIV_029255 [Neospora caninum Liverpool]
MKVACRVVFCLVSLFFLSSLSSLPFSSLLLVEGASSQAPPATQKGNSSSPPRTAADDKATVHKVGRELDEEDETFLREEFMEYDTNGDGMLDAYEVRITHPEIGNQELFSFFRSVDANQDGLLTLREYREYVAASI